MNNGGEIYLKADTSKIEKRGILLKRISSKLSG
jgi:hypothetical protein